MAAALAFLQNDSRQLYLLGIASEPEPENARNSGVEYSKIWDLFAFRESFTVHLARFTEGVLRSPASITSGLRKLIAASVSYRNECRFCTQAHAAAALLGDEALVWSGNLPAISAEDVEEVRAAGWDDEAIYYAITTCALFNFYNRWITATGVPEMSPEAHRMQGQNLAERGYIRAEKKQMGEKTNNGAH